MTYYEIVSLLDEMELKPINKDYIEKLNNANISLEGDRYLRFINQVNYLLTRRLKDYMNKITTLVCEVPLSTNELKMELEALKKEVEYNKKIACNNLVNKENQEIFLKSIIQNSNEIYKSICDLYQDEDAKRMISEYIKED